MNDLRDAPIIAIPGNDVEVLVSLFDIDGYPINVKTLENLRVTLFKNKKKIPLEHECLMENHPEAETHLCLRLDAKKHIKEEGEYEIEIQFVIKGMNRSSGKIEFLNVRDDITWDDISRELETSSEFIRYNFKTGVGSVLNCGPKGERGESLRIKMSFDSISKMYETTEDELIDPDTQFPLRRGEFAIIASNLESNDNGKIYMYLGKRTDAENASNTPGTPVYGKWKYITQITNLGNYYTKLETDAELNKKINNTDIVQSLGQDTDLVISQKTVTDTLNEKVNSSDIVQELGLSTERVMSQKTVTDKLNEKVNFSDIVQELGFSTEKVMSQNCITELINNTVKTAFPWDDTDEGNDYSDYILVTDRRNSTPNDKGKSITKSSVHINDLLLKMNITQSKGNSSEMIMSQKAVTDTCDEVFEKLFEEMAEINKGNIYKSNQKIKTNENLEVAIDESGKLWYQNSSNKRSYSETILGNIDIEGNPLNSDFLITHGLNTENVIVYVYNEQTNIPVEFKQIEIVDTNCFRIFFEVGPGENDTYTIEVLEDDIANNYITQSSGQSTNKIMSQKTVTDELERKINKTNIVQTTGTEADKIISQKAITEILNKINPNVIVFLNDVTNISPSIANIGDRYYDINDGYIYVWVDSTYATKLPGWEKSSEADNGTEPMKPKNDILYINLSNGYLYKMHNGSLLCLTDSQFQDVPHKYVGDIYGNTDADGNPTNNEFTIFHSLNTRDIIVNIYKDIEQVLCNITIIDENRIRVRFDVGPGLHDMYKVVIIG